MERVYRLYIHIACVINNINTSKILLYTVQPKSAGASGALCDENTAEPSSGTAAGDGTIYDYVEWKTTTKDESAAQYEKIELSTNAAYGRVSEMNH